MKFNKKRNKLLVIILPSILAVSCLAIGFGSWAYSSSGVKGSSTSFGGANVGSMHLNRALTFVGYETNCTIVNSGLYTNYHETVDGKTFQYMKPGGSDFRIKFKFALDNSLYKYYDRDHDANFVFMNAGITVGNIKSDAYKYFGVPNGNPGDSALLINGEGWHTKERFIGEPYNSRNRSQYIRTSSEFVFNNRTPSARQFNFFLEFCFNRQLLTLMTSNQLVFSARIDLKYNQR